MKILHTNFHRGWGGQSNRILTVCRGLKARGHGVMLAVPPGSELALRAGEAGIEVFTGVRFARGFRPRAIGSDALHLRRLIAERKFDVVHTHGSQDSWAIAAALIRFRDRPLVIRTRHNLFAIRDHFFNRRLYGRWTDAIVCISSAIEADCRAKPYLKAENLEVVHSAVDSQRFAQTPKPGLRAELGLEGKFVGGIVGRLRVEKGHRYALEALRAVLAETPDFVLLVAGSGTLAAELEALAGRLGVDRNVRFLGFREDVPRVLASLDLFVMPSISEGLGTAALEAAAAGLPIVASDVGGIPDILGRGERGLLVPPADPEALAEAINKMTRDADLRRRLAEAAKIFVAENFSEAALVEKTEAVYLKRLALAGHARPRT